MKEEKINIALNILNKDLADLIKEYTFNKNEENNCLLKEKIDVLEKIKDEIYKGDIHLAEKIIKKSKEGIN